MLWYADFFDVSLDYIFGRTDKPQGKLYENQPKVVFEDELKVKEKEIENILSAVKKGFAQDTLLKELAGPEKQRDDISLSIAKEKIECPILSKDHFKMALNNYRKLDITKFEGKRKLIDTFINAIYVYDHDIKIVYNGNGKEETVTLEEMESSTLFSSRAPKKQAY